MIRRATIQDAPSIYSVHMAAIRVLAAESYSAEQIEAWCGGRAPENYHAPIVGQVVLVYQAEHEVIGFAQLAPEQSLVVAVYVSPEHARKGIGLALLRALEEQALCLGITTLHLQASINAIAFYAAAGYSKGALSNHTVAGGVTIPCRAMARTMR